MHSVNMGEGGLDAVVTLGAGDMRRTLNILQVGTQPVRRLVPRIVQKIPG